MQVPFNYRLIHSFLIQHAQNLRNITLLALFMTLSSFCYAGSHSLKLAIPKDVLIDYEKLLDGRSPLQIKNFSGTHSRRDVVEVILLMQALNLGGLTADFTFVPINSYQRILRQIESGQAVMSATTNWKSDLSGPHTKLLISLPLIRDGEFEAGLYTAPSNEAAKDAKSLSDIQKLSAVSNQGWKADWETLQDLNLNQLHSTTSWVSMVKMVNLKRVDFLLAPFQATADLSLSVEGMKLIPIPNVKVGLKGSRHFAISTVHPKGLETLKALNKGLQQLRQRGIIEKAYKASGFLNTQTSTWEFIDQ